MGSKIKFHKGLYKMSAIVEKLLPFFKSLRSLNVILSDARDKTETWLSESFKTFLSYDGKFVWLQWRCYLPKNMLTKCRHWKMSGMVKFMQRTWQISGRICLPCGKNLSPGHIAKCDPKFLSWKKLWKSQKTLKTPYCLGGAGRFWKTRAKQ